MSDVPETETLASAARELLAEWDQIPVGQAAEHWQEASARLRAALAAHDTPPPGCGPECSEHHTFEPPCEAWIDTTAPMGEAPSPDICHNGHPFEPGIDVDDPEHPDPTFCNVCGELRRPSSSLGDVSDSEPPVLPENWCDTCEGEGEFIDDRCTLDMVSLRCKMPCPDCAGGVDWPACEHPVISTPGGGQPDADDELLARAACVRWVNARTGEIKERHLVGVDHVTTNDGEVLDCPWESTALDVALSMVPDLAKAVEDAHFRGVELTVHVSEREADHG